MRKAFLATFLAALLAIGAVAGLATHGWVAGGEGNRLAIATAAAADLELQPSPVNRPANARPDLGAQWLDENGRYRFPPNDGFKGTPQDVTLAPGTMIDRYGQPGGRFLSPVGTPYGARALPYDKAKMDYHVYEVRAPLPVKAGEIVPWFDEPGGGTQYMTAAPVTQLIAEGSLAEVKK